MTLIALLTFKAAFDGVFVVMKRNVPLHPYQEDSRSPGAS